MGRAQPGSWGAWPQWESCGQVPFSATEESTVPWPAHRVLGLGTERAVVKHLQTLTEARGWSPMHRLATSCGRHVVPCHRRCTENQLRIRDTVLIRVKLMDRLGGRRERGLRGHPQGLGDVGRRTSGEAAGGGVHSWAAGGPWWGKEAQGRLSHQHGP